MTEFPLIKEYCHGIGPDHEETILSVGDDAAIVKIPDGMELAVSTDAMVSGVHFFHNASPESIAHKLLAVNLSDMAAMGAQPKWATLALTLPEFDKLWLNGFYQSLKQVAEHYRIQLIGGDTCNGPLNLSLSIMGLLPKGKFLSRHGAKVGDDVYVSNVLGDAALGLKCLQGEYTPDQDVKAELISALEYPLPRVSLGAALLEVANACLDISDGLLGDLGHICERSSVAIDIDIDRLPLSLNYQAYLNAGGDFAAALTGGDDYELCFCASESKRGILRKIAEQCDVRLNRIGKITAQSEKKVSLHCSGTAYTLPDSKGFEHFS